MISEPYISVDFIIPPCLHMNPEWIFKIKDGRIIAEIRIKDKKDDSQDWRGTGMDVEFSSDSTAVYRHSHLYYRIKPLLSKSGETLPLKDYESIALRLTNKFIDAYKLFFKRHGLEYYNDISQLISGIKVKMVDSTKGFTGDRYSISPNIIMAQSFEPELAHKHIQSILNSGIDLSLTFLMDARHSFAEWHFIPALLSSLIALEIKAGDTIRNLLSKFGLSNTEIRDFLRQNKQLPNLKSYFKMLIPASFDLPEDKIFESCKLAREKRNKVIHRGERDIDFTLLEIWMNDIEKMISFCDELIEIEDD